MTAASDRVDDARMPLVYAERERGVVGNDTFRSIDEWSVLPGALSGALASASALIVVDPLSFPFEDVPAHSWQLPMTVVWPDDHDLDVLMTLLHEPLLSELTFLDRLVVRDDATWERLSARYKFGASQRVRGGNTPVSALVAQAVRAHGIAELAHEELTMRGVGTLDPWTLRVGENKRDHLAELHAIRSIVEGARERRVLEGALVVAHVGAGIGRLRAAFGDADYSGFVAVAPAAQQAQANFPDVPFAALGARSAIPSPRESLDLAVLTHAPSLLRAEQRVNLFATVWRALRVGGQLVVLDSFVPRASRPYVGADELVAELLRGAGHGVVVTDVRSLRSSSSPTADRGLIVTTKIGVPQRW